MNESEKARFRDKLKTLLSEIEEYLEKSEDSAEAVSPDKGLGRLSRMEAMALRTARPSLVSDALPVEK